MVRSGNDNLQANQNVLQIASTSLFPNPGGRSAVFIRTEALKLSLDTESLEGIGQKQTT
jgi:hypothetical protein